MRIRDFAEIVNAHRRKLLSRGIRLADPDFMRVAQAKDLGGLLGAPRHAAAQDNDDVRGRKRIGAFEPAADPTKGEDGRDNNY